MVIFIYVSESERDKSKTSTQPTPLLSLPFLTHKHSYFSHSRSKKPSIKNQTKPTWTESSWFGLRIETDENWFSTVLFYCEQINLVWFIIGLKIRLDQTVHTPKVLGKEGEEFSFYLGDKLTNQTTSGCSFSHNPIWI